jgi:hypothetical protein
MFGYKCLIIIFKFEIWMETHVLRNLELIGPLFGFKKINSNNFFYHRFLFRGSNPSILKKQ